jgi:hypothetical protein
VAEKHDFRSIQQKIPQVSYFAKKRDSNPPPHGYTAADIAKMFANRNDSEIYFKPISFLDILHYLHHNIQGDQSWCAVTKWV